MLLWFNSITLFFHNLSNKSHATEEISYDVAGWRAKVYCLKKSGRSHSSSVPSLTGHFQHTASYKFSVSSKWSALADGCDEEGMGLSDQDETFGMEHDDAHSSLAKEPKVQATSAVSLILFN